MKPIEMPVDWMGCYEVSGVEMNIREDTVVGFDML